MLCVVCCSCACARSLCPDQDSHSLLACSSLRCVPLAARLATCRPATQAGWRCWPSLGLTPLPLSLRAPLAAKPPSRCVLEQRCVRGCSCCLLSFAPLLAPHLTNLLAGPAGSHRRSSALDGAARGRGCVACCCCGCFARAIVGWACSVRIADSQLSGACQASSPPPQTLPCTPDCLPLPDPLCHDRL